MSSQYDSDLQGKEVLAIINKYYPSIEPLMEIIGYASEELSSKKPQSGLSNLATDVIYSAALPYIGKNDRMISLTNFGGIRSNLPKGDIRIYDVFSTFPFDNKVVIVDIKGKDIRKLIERFIGWHFEALGGIELVVKDKKIESCMIGGEPLDDDFIYKLATIDFLITGGDSLSIGKHALKILDTEIVLRDAVVDYIKAKSKNKYIFNNTTDNRITIL